MKAREYNLIEEAIEIAADRGWNRAHKHMDDPSGEHIKECFVRAAMEEICERFDFEGPPATVEDIALALNAAMKR